MVNTYTCPSCGGDMVFDAKTGKVKCQYCGHESSVKEVNNSSETNRDKTEEVNVTDGDNVYGEFQNDGNDAINLMVYKCPACGAEILTDDTTAATFCSFCGRPAMIADRLEGEKKPAYVIPFKITKDSAVEKYTAWAKKGILTPGVFARQSTIEKITGMYVPFWLYDYDADIMLDAVCTRVRTQRKGDYEYVHTDYYRVYRELGAEYIRIPADASEKMPDDVMDKLEPFNYKELEGFEMPYLSGYYAEKYNYTGEQMAPRIESRVRGYINKAAMDTIYGYGSVSVRHRNVKLYKKQAKYALLPVWILNCSYKGKNFMFAMNGQTGKIVADKPVSTGKLFGWWGGISAVTFAILFSVGRFLL